MSIAEIFEQAQTLTLRERKELVKLLVDTFDTSEPLPHLKTGAEIVSMLQRTDPIELVHPEIEDPVEWVKQIRRDQAQQRGLDWGSDE